ncbi:MAG: hypothetical protein JRI50_10670 [Deltaproteobacteria bacterium]|nr:hypothetical protein [Deltaproteobacteria bacterium]
MVKLQNVQPVELFLPLYERICVLRDQDKDVWLFEEKLSNGRYPRYTLQGETLSQDGPKHKAYLFCGFKCDMDKRVVSVLLEDIVTTKQGKHVGTWMVNRLIALLREVGRAIEFDKVYGDFRPSDEHLALVFFLRFNFRLGRLKKVEEQIYCPVACPQIQRSGINSPAGVAQR